MRPQKTNTVSEAPTDFNSVNILLLLDPLFKWTQYPFMCFKLYHP